MKIKKLYEKDENKVEVIAYHGSSKKFNRFEVSKVNSGTSDGGMWGPGLYFTDSVKIAKTWNDHGYLYKVRLSFDNPFIAKNEEDRDRLADLLHLNMNSKGINTSNTKDFFDAGYDSIISENEQWESSDDGWKTTYTTVASQYIAFKDYQIEILKVVKY